MNQRLTLRAGILVLVVATVGLLYALLDFGGAIAKQFPDLPRAGAATEYGLPTLRMTSDLLACATIGALLGALLTCQAITETATRKMLTWASTFATLWTLSTAFELVFSYSDFAPLPLSKAFDAAGLTSFVQAVPQAEALLIQLLLTSFIGAACFRLRSTKQVAVTLFFTLLAVLPPPLTGHAAASGNHSLGISTLGLHVLAATLWFGGVGVLVALSRARLNSDSLATTVQRFSQIAFWCFISVAVSGVINALLRIHHISQLFTTHYGLLVLLKTLGLITVGAIGARHRNKTIPAIKSGNVSAFRKLIAIEAVVMTLTFTVAVALSRSAPPYNPLSSQISPARLVLGYDMPPPVTLWHVISKWQLDGFTTIWAAFAIALYLTAVRTLKRSGRSWPSNRTYAWIAGWLVVVVATSSGVGTYASVLFSMHMAEHMTLNMIAPLLMVLGEPITLALRALPRSAFGPRNGPREWLTDFLRSAFAKFITNGVVAAILFALSLWLLYFTPLFGEAMSNHYGHALMQAHFIAVGFLFFYVLVGTDMTAKRLPYPARLGLLVMTMISHAFFGLVLTNTSGLIAEGYYLSLHRPWGATLLGDQHTGAAFAWAFGELPITLVLLVLFFRWMKSEERASEYEDALPA